LTNNTIGFIVANHFRVSNHIIGNNKKQKNRQVTISEIIPEQQQEEKEFIILCLVA
jgi:hypothetical protein